MLCAVALALILSPLLVHGFAFEDLPSICNNESLTLAGIASSKLLNNFIVSPNLKCINIVNGNVESIEEGAFDGVPNLMYLNLERNLILPSNLLSFGNISNIRALIFNDQRNRNYYDTVLKVHTIYPELRYLNLRNTKISNITSYAYNPFPKLLHLDVSSNSFSSFNFIQQWNTTLTHLNLSSNQISQISLNELGNLEWLSLNDNNIRSVGDGYNLDLRGLSKLQYLTIANNKIDSISRTSFNHTVNLRYLNISNNAVATLYPEIFTSLNSLEVLVLDNNMFNSMPIITPLNLTKLSMDCNNITYLTASSLVSMPKLKVLSLARNMISSIYAQTFQSQKMLEELYLNDNELTYMPTGWCQSMKNLRYLNLAGNQFTSVDSVLNLPSVRLREIHLDGNPIVSIDVNIVRLASTNATIYLNIGSTRSKGRCASSKRYGTRY